MADPRVPALGVVACVGAFLAIADAVGAGRTQWLDDHVLSLLRRPGEPSRPVGPAWLEDAVRSVTVLGSSTLLILLGAAAGVALLVRRQFHALGLVLVAVAGGQVLNDLLKGAFQRARPAPFQLADVASPGFPSGHAMDSAVTYLTLAAVFSRLVQSRRVRLLLFAVAALSSALAGASRVYLGVHYPSDVVAGWVAGVGWVLLCWMALASDLPRGKPAQT